MKQVRRELMRSGSAWAVLAAAGILAPKGAAAMPPRAAFDAKTLADALKAIGATPAESKDVVIVSPDIAENGAVVPVGVQSNLPKTEEIYVLIEKNPFPLAAAYKLGASAEPNVQTRFKMGQSTNVVVVVRADGKLYSAVKETKVTLGGCGG
jgi:sulfur-oxidizing protein SoxY